MPEDSDHQDDGDGISLERHVVRMTSYLIQLTSFTGKVFLSLPRDKQEMLKDEFRELAIALSKLADLNEPK